MKQRTRRQDQGFVAIFTVLIIMGVLTLLTIGFTNITNRAQRQALDDQLNTQAYYAAETGINRVQSRLIAGTQAEKTDCLDQPNIYGYDVDGDTSGGSQDYGISISCLLVDMTPPSLISDSVGTDRPYIAPLTPEDGSSIGNVLINWDVERGVDDARQNTALVPNSGLISSSPALTPEDEWGDKISVLRVDLIRYPRSDTTGTSIRGATAVNNLYTYFLYPTSGTGSAVPFGLGAPPASQGQVIMVRCDTTTTQAYRCRSSVSLQGPPSDRYYIRVTSYYHSSSVEIMTQQADGSPQSLMGAQAIVDSTGRVSDVSRRIQVRVPIFVTGNPFMGLSNPYSILSGDSICKRIWALPYENSTDHSHTDRSDPACQLGP